MTIMPTPIPLPYTINDGGRADAGFRGETGDCVTRAVAIATGVAYRRVYDDLYDLARALDPRARRPRGDVSPRNGVIRRVYQTYLESIGWIWTPTMHIGSGCRVHLAQDEIPMTGPVIASLSRHVAAVVDGTVHDIYDPGRGGTRCVYGIFTPQAVALRTHAA